jgi:hypothetical protein
MDEQSSMEEQAEALAAKVAEVVETWGPSFAYLAEDPRVDFEDGKISVALWKPVRIGAATVERLRFDEPNLGQLADLDRVPGETAKVRRLLMHVCGMTEKEASALGVRDLVQAGRVLDAFGGAARAIGV